MTLLTQIQNDLREAMKAQDEFRLNALRLIKTALERYEKDQRKPLDEQTEQRTLGTLLKQRVEAAEMFRQGNRIELAKKEEAEAELIKSYLPQEATEADLKARIATAIEELSVTPGPAAKKMGLVIKSVQAQLQAQKLRVDGRMLSDLVKKELGV